MVLRVYRDSGVRERSLLRKKNCKSKLLSQKKSDVFEEQKETDRTGTRGRGGQMTHKGSLKPP